MNENSSISFGEKQRKVIAGPKELIRIKIRKGYWVIMSPRTKLFILALFIVFLLNFLLHLMDIQFGIGLGRFSFVIITTVLLYALLTRIAEKWRQN